MHDMFPQFSDQLVKQLLLAFGIALIMSHDITPDLNLLAKP